MLRKTVKVGGIVFKVNVVRGPLVLDNRVCRGTCSVERCEIDVGEDQKDGRRGQTLWHEVLEAILVDRNISYLQDEEDNVSHRCLDIIASGLNALMVDNGVEFWEVDDAQRL